jgi:uncharacterized protein (DUF2141 family)
MKQLFLICFAFWSQVVCSQTYDLAITIPNLKSSKGVIQIGIYNNKETFPHADEQYKVIFIDVGSFSGTCIIKDLPKGEYAVAIMHDENSDKICNTNFLGFPKEGYGFSNNIKPIFSAPTFNECKIDLNRNLSITIGMIY